MHLRIEKNSRFRIRYRDDAGKLSERVIAPRAVYRANAHTPPAIEAWCDVSGSKRWFRSDRVLHATCMATGRPIADLAAYLRAQD